MFIKKNNILRREFMFFSYTEIMVLPTEINTKPWVVRLEKHLGFLPGRRAENYKWPSKPNRRQKERGNTRSYV